MLKDKVLKFLKEIPTWKVVSYKYLAEKFDTHPRAIAVFMKHNKYPDIFPCYKVVSTSGNIWWYSGVWWVNGKIERLKKDWIRVKNNFIEEIYFYKEV